LPSWQEYSKIGFEIALHGYLTVHGFVNMVGSSTRRPIQNRIRAGARERLAGWDGLPFQFSDFAYTVRTYADELKKLDTDQRAQAEELNRELDEGVFATAAPISSPSTRR
jgi:hypothetical protein